MVEKDNVVKTNPDPTSAVKEALTLAIKNLDEKFAAQFPEVVQLGNVARFSRQQGRDAARLRTRAELVVG